MKSKYSPYDSYSAHEEDVRISLIKEHMPMINILVERMVPLVPSFLNRDEMKNVAMVGLIDAAKRFDPSKGVLFKTFAERRMRGAIFDEVRNMDWFPRSLREKQANLSKTMKQLEKQLGRSPDESEMAAAMGIDIESYRRLLSQASRLGLVSLNRSMDYSENGRSFLEELFDQDAKSPSARLEAEELTQKVKSCLEKLSEKERHVISLYYYEELTQKEIAEVLQLSEGRISQLHSQALSRLKGALRCHC
jgi:RNA polymerase sigma factor for flagellar operon FliA